MKAVYKGAARWSKFHLVNQTNSQLLRSQTYSVPFIFSKDLNDHHKMTMTRQELNCLGLVSSQVMAKLCQL